MPVTSVWRHHILVSATVIFLLALAYALMRYCVFSHTSVAFTEIYILNKAISVTALCFLVLASTADRSHRRAWGLLGFTFGWIHIGISTFLWGPAHYAKLFSASGELNLLGWGTAVGGLIALAVNCKLFCAAPKTRPDTRDRGFPTYLGSLVLFLVAFHVTILGSRSWCILESWPGYLPPITT